MTELSLASRIESVLFYKGEPVEKKRLAALVGCSEDDLAAGLAALRDELSNRGLALVETETEAMLGTSAAATDLIESIRREEISRDLGKAGLETLAIVLYKGPLTRREIDYVRGVNSSFILRNLMVRGLVERVESEGKERGFLYKATTELLAHMGLSRREDLPEYEIIQREIENMAATEGSDGTESA